MNNTKTMTFEEIIEVIKDNFDSVNGFAYDKIPCLEPYSDEALEAGKKKDEFAALHSKQEWYNSPEYKEYDKMPSKNSIASKEWLISKRIPVWEEIDQYGGEGQGDTWYSIKYFKDHDVYIKVNGWYQSHNGTDFNGWEDCSEVKPTQKTVTIYE